MKKTKTLPAILLALASAFAALTSAHAQNAKPLPKPSASQPALPAGALQEGTFADPQLVKDATLGVAGMVTVRGCERPDGMTPYVMSKPEGPAGYREWKERWVVSGCGKQYPVEIAFRESGPGKGVDYRILNPSRTSR